MTTKELRTAVRKAISRQVHIMTQVEMRALLLRLGDAIIDEMDYDGTIIDQDQAIEDLFEVLDAVKLDPYKIAEQLLNDEEDANNADS
jgi:hypothetical protein